MKLVVPLMIPITRLIGSPRRLSRRARMIGMPPATAASKSRSTPASSLTANSSVPTLASSSLLAVTTGLPARSAAVISSRAGSIPPMTSTTRSMELSATTAWASRVRTPSARSTSRSRLRLRTATAPDLETNPGTGFDRRLLARHQLDEGGTDVATPENTDPHELGHGRKATGWRLAVETLSGCRPAYAG